MSDTMLTYIETDVDLPKVLCVRSVSKYENILRDSYGKKIALFIPPPHTHTVLILLHMLTVVDFGSQVIPNRQGHKVEK